MSDSPTDTVSLKRVVEVLDRARATLDDGHKDEAYAMCIALLEEGGLGLLPLVKIQDLMRQAGHSDEAKLICDQLCEVLDGLDENNTDDPAAMINSCKLRLEMERMDGAFACAMKMRKLFPNEPEVHMLQCLTLLVSGHFDPDLIDPEPALEEANPMVLLLGLASMMAQHNQPDGALRVLHRASALAKKPGEIARVDTMHAAVGGTVNEIDQRAMATGIFDSFASNYDQQLGKIANNGPNVIAAMLAMLDLAQDGSRDILDAGCGTGLCAPILRPYARHLHGIDVSIPMLVKCRDKGTFDLLSRTDLAARDTYPDGKFDLVVSGDVMVYFGDLDQVLKNLADVLRPGGRIVFTVEEAQPPLPEAGHRLTPSGRNAHTEAYLRAALSNAGFGPVDLVHRDRLRKEFSSDVPGLAVTACKLG